MFTNVIPARIAFETLNALLIFLLVILIIISDLLDGFMARILNQVTDFGKNPTIEHIQTPNPQPDQIRLKIMSCGLNFADILLKNGTYQETPQLPFVLGMEVSGVVDALGSNVTNFSIGDRVAVFGGQGGLAEYGCFDLSRCVHLPQKMNFDDAAAFQIAYGTSHLALGYKVQQCESLQVFQDGWPCILCRFPIDQQSHLCQKQHLYNQVFEIGLSQIMNS